jgi:HSP20 family protein
MNAETPVRVENGRPATVGEPQAVQRAQAARPFTTQTPSIDIHETPDGLILEADLPGVAQDGVTIQLEDNVLNLTAKVQPTAPGESRLIHEEFRQGDFQRSFILSDEVDRERISAELKNGVLRLTLPKAERAKTRRIEVTSS